MKQTINYNNCIVYQTNNLGEEDFEATEEQKVDIDELVFYIKSKLIKNKKINLPEVLIKHILEIEETFFSEYE